MDANDQAKLDNAKREIEKYINHPFTTQIEQDNREAQESLLTIILKDDVKDIETLVAHFVAVGHLRGLRDSEAKLRETLSDIETKLSEA